MSSESQFDAQGRYVSRYRLSYERAKRLVEVERISLAAPTQATVDYLLMLLGRMEADIAMREYYDDRRRQAEERRRYA